MSPAAPRSTEVREGRCRSVSVGSGGSPVHRVVGHVVRTCASSPVRSSMSRSASPTSWSARWRSARATAISSPIRRRRQVVGGAVARPLGAEAVRRVGDEHDGGTRVVAGLEHETRTCHSRRCLRSVLGTRRHRRRLGRRGLLVTGHAEVEHRSRPGVDQAGVAVRPPHDEGRAAVGSADLEHLPVAGGLVDVLCRKDDAVSDMCSHVGLLDRSQIRTAPVGGAHSGPKGSESQTGGTRSRDLGPLCRCAMWVWDRDRSCARPADDPREAP